jgi:hypothetical protein
MSWTNEFGNWRLVYFVFFKANSLIAGVNGCANPNLTIPIPNGARDSGNLKPACFFGIFVATISLNRLNKTRLDKMGLESASIGPFHFFPDSLNLGCIHRVSHQNTLFQEFQ